MKVQSQERRIVALLIATVFFLLAGYYMLKVAREAEVLNDRGVSLAGYALKGPELKAFARAVQALVLVGVFVPIYSWISSRITRRTLTVGLTLFYLLNIELFFVLSRIGVPNLGFFFYIWVGIFNMSIIAQFWSYVSDVTEEQAGAIRFPRVMVGASLGGVAGLVIDRVLRAYPVFEADPFLALHVAATLLLVSLVFYLRADVLTGSSAGGQVGGQPLQLGNGLQRVFSSPYLRLIALSLLLLNLVNSTGEYILDNYIVDYASGVADRSPADQGTEAWDRVFGGAIGGAFNSYYLVVNIVSLLLQLFVAARLITFIGVSGVLLILPLVALGTYGLAFFGAGFALFQLVKIAENATDYSISNTVRQLLWLPTSREEKYQAKQAADTVFTRLGDLAHAIVIIAGAGWLGFGTREFALANVVLCVLWLIVVCLLGRAYQRARTRVREAGR